MIKILCSHIELPSDRIGSWNIMYTKLIEDNAELFDVIISPKPTHIFEKVKQMYVNNSFFYNRLMRKFNNNYSYYNYWKKIEKFVVNEEKIVVNVIDNINILFAIDYFSRKKKIRNKIKIIYHLHSFNFDVDVYKRRRIYDAIDKLVLLSEASYFFQLKNNYTIPCEVDILYNGIDSNKFSPLSIDAKNRLRLQLKMESEIKYFLWVSQDRPKKGLFLILKAWEKANKNNENIELIIIGTKNEIKGKNIRWLGRMPNVELAQYYQAVDYYLFSSLMHEGHSLALTEALKSGAKCIASDIGPNAEVLHYGDLGMLIDKPNFVDSWVEAIERVLCEDISFNKMNLDLNIIYDSEDWKKGIVRINQI